MKDFILDLYANENFPIYLGLFIIVLLIAFFVIYFLGKKDLKKLIETGQLPKLKPKEERYEDAFDEEDIRDKDAFKEIEQTQIFEFAPKKGTQEVESLFEETKTLELPILKKDSSKEDIRHVRVEDFDKLANSIADELEEIEHYQSKRNNYDEETSEQYNNDLYEDNSIDDMDLPRLKR